MIYVVATFNLRPGALEAFVSSAYLLIDTARRQPGCVYYDLHASVTDPDRALCVEQWDSRAALATHLGSPAVADFGAVIAPHVLSSKVEIIHPDHVDTL